MMKKKRGGEEKEGRGCGGGVRVGGGGGRRGGRRRIIMLAYTYQFFLAMVAVVEDDALPSCFPRCLSPLDCCRRPAARSQRQTRTAAHGEEDHLRLIEAGPISVGKQHSAGSS